MDPEVFSAPPCEESCAFADIVQSAKDFKRAQGLCRVGISQSLGTFREEMEKMMGIYPESIC